MKLGNREFNLSHGSHLPGEGKGCVMEVVGVKWLMRHGWSLTDAWNRLTDTPPCTDPTIYKAAQTVNDGLSPDGLSRLELRVDRLMSCHTPTNEMTARRVRVRVACWAARRVLHLVEESRREIALRTIETAEAWLRGEATEDDCAAAYATAAYAADDLLDFIDELLDAWDKAIAAEGCAADEPPIPTQVGGS